MDIISFISGNVCSLLAMITDSVSATRKTGRGVLLVQCLSQLIYGAGAILLKGYSAAVQNAISILRNLAALKGIQSKVFQWVLLVLGVVLGIYFNNNGIFGYLPVLANLQYTLAVFRYADNPRVLKYSLIVSVLLFAVFSVAIWNVVGVVCNLIVLVTTVIDLARNK